VVTHDTTRFRGSGPRRMRISGELGGVGGGEGRSVCGPGGPVNGRVPHRSGRCSMGRRRSRRRNGPTPGTGIVPGTENNRVLDRGILAPLPDKEEEEQKEEEWV
jgi:hypothetical protein